MRICYLMGRVGQIWGGVKVALEDANELADRGHDVVVVAEGGPPSWFGLRCGFVTVDEGGLDGVPDADVYVGTYWLTIPKVAALARDRGAVAVHLCQGYEGAFPELQERRTEIDSVYSCSDDEVALITISEHLTTLMADRFGRRAWQVCNAVDHDVMWPGDDRARRGDRDVVRVGLVGPFRIPWKDIPTGYRACMIAARGGLDLQVVRVSSEPPTAAERTAPVGTEWNQSVPPGAMGEIYRSMDVLLGTSSGAAEGFFLPAVEAMACGVPCVLTDVPCFNGYGPKRPSGEAPRYARFVPPSDPAAMAVELVRVVLDPSLRADLVAAGLEAAAYHTRSRRAAQLEDALRDIVSRRTRHHAEPGVVTVPRPDAAAMGSGTPVIPHLQPLEIASMLGAAEPRR